MKSVELIANRLGAGPWVARATVWNRKGFPVIMRETAPTFRDLAEQLDKRIEKLEGPENGQKERTA